MKRQVFVFFPYVWQNQLHPWAESQLKAFKQSGFKVTVYPKKKNKRFVINLLNLLINFPRIIKQINEADYVLLSSCFFSNFYTLLVKAFHKKIILSHISTHLYASEKTPFIKNLVFLNSVFKKFDGLSFKKADYVFTYAFSIASALAKTFNLNKENIFVIETLVDTNIFGPFYQKKAEKIKKHFNIVNKDILLYHGRCHPWHGLKFFFEAVPCLLKNNPNFAFVILGTEKEELKKFFPKSVLNNPCFYFPGRLKNHDDLPVYIQIADLWFGRFTKAPYPSLGHCVVEAMACAKPVIIYKTWEHERLLIDKKDSIFVAEDNPKDICQKISFYFKNKENRKKLVLLGKNARKTALKKFSVLSFSENLKKILV